MPKPIKNNSPSINRVNDCSMAKKPLYQQSVSIDWIFGTTELTAINSRTKPVTQILGNFLVANPVSVMVMHVVVFSSVKCNRLFWVTGFLVRCLVHPSIIQDFRTWRSRYDEFVNTAVLSVISKLYKQRISCRCFNPLRVECHGTCDSSGRNKRLRNNVVLAENGIISVNRLIGSILDSNRYWASSIKSRMLVGDLVASAVACQLGFHFKRVVATVCTRKAELILVHHNRCNRGFTYHQIRLYQHIRCKLGWRRQARFISASVHEWKA